ncbi:MAG: hypothetical protein H6P95_587 [Candidatus Aminicenantes bacterium]|nr:hypothetical protein [Candidatus Aminicenantes bacterium]
MDAFWTEDEAASREKAARYFRDLTALTQAEAAAPGAIWTDLEGALENEGAVWSRPGRLAGRMALLEAAARHSPGLGRDLLAWRTAAAPLDPLEGSVLRLGCLAGTAAHVLEAGVRAAREQGAFSSSLMGCREVQESLAGLLTGAGLVRLGACRLCRLLEKGERDRASRESSGLDGPAAELEAGIRSVARALLGGAWVAANLAFDGTPVDERTPT